MTTINIPLYNTATHVLSQKLKSLTLANECLSINRRIYTKQMMICKYLSDMAKKKIELSNTLVSIYTQQISEFTAERETRAQAIYDEINELDEPSEEYNTMTAELSSLHAELNQKYQEQQLVEQNIPEQTNVEQLYNRVTR
jgi:hypothetical protein